MSKSKNYDSRMIPLTDSLLELFAGMQTGEPGEDVFTKMDGGAYSQAPYVFSAVVDKLELNKDRAERDRIVFHSIRHTVATRLAQRLGPRDLMDVMGRRTVQMAMRYVHANEDAKAKALSMLGTVPEAGRVLQFGKGVIIIRNEFTGIIERDGDWFVAYCPEIPGANGQGRHIPEALHRLAEAILLILEDRREDALRGMPREAIREVVVVQ